MAVGAAAETPIAHRANAEYAIPRFCMLPFHLQLSTWRRIGRQIAKNELDCRQDKLINLGIEEHFRSVSQGAVEYPAFSVALDPANRVIVVFTDERGAAAVEFGRFVHID